MGMNLWETANIPLPKNTFELPVELISENLDLREKHIYNFLNSIDNRMDFSMWPGGWDIKGNVSQIATDLAKSIYRIEKVSEKWRTLTDTQLEKLQVLLRGSLVKESVYGEQNEKRFLKSISSDEIKTIKNKVIEEAKKMLRVR